MLKFNVLRFVLLVATTSFPMIATGFTVPTTPGATTTRYVPRSTTQRVHQLGVGSASLSYDDQQNDAVLRDFERKEKKMTKQLEKQQSRLSQAQEAIQLLQAQKQQYLNGLKLEKTPPGGNFSETALRSAVKAFLWRIVAGSVTFITSLRFSGSVATALSIVGSDFFSKAFTMFIGERLMNKSQGGRSKGSDSMSRSLTKALIWRAFAICNTLTMAIFFAKDLSIASKIAGSDAIFKTALMFFYERIWARVQWGKEYIIEFSI